MKKKKRRLKSSSIDQCYRTELTLSDPQSLLKFDINKERPRILQTLATASQTANNLVNRLQLCDPNQIATDPILQALVEKAKVSQKGLVRYIQTVSDHDPEGEYLGTLLNTNAQVLAALDLFNDLIQSKVEGRQIDQLADRLKKVSLSGQPSDVEEEFDIFNDSNRSEERPIAIVSPQSPSADLLGLEFGTTSLSKSGGDQLQVPLVPDPAGASTLQTPSSYDPGTLSDFSDFEDDEGSSNCSSPNDSSETTTSPSHLTTPPTNNPFHKYLNDPSFGGDRTKPANANQSLDPFADPFLDPSSTTGR